MIDPDEVNSVVHAIQELPLRDDLVVVVVFLDTKDGTLVASAPAAVNIPVVLEMASDLYSEQPPDASGFIAPRN